MPKYAKAVSVDVRCARLAPPVYGVKACAERRVTWKGLWYHLSLANHLDLDRLPAEREHQERTTPPGRVVERRGAKRDPDCRRLAAIEPDRRWRDSPERNFRRRFPTARVVREHHTAGTPIALAQHETSARDVEHRCARQQAAHFEPNNDAGSGSETDVLGREIGSKSPHRHLRGGSHRDARATGHFEPRHHRLRVAGRRGDARDKEPCYRPAVHVGSR